MLKTKSTSQSTSNQPATNQQPTTNKNEKNEKNEKNKHKYGEFNNVLLTDDQAAKLRNKFNGGFEEKVKVLDEGIELKGYKYKNHYLAILKWAAKDTKDGKSKVNTDAFGREPHV